MRPRRLLAPLAAVGFSVLSLQHPAAAPALIQINNPAPAADARFGTGVAGIGDVTGDGIPDFVAGAPGAGTAFVLSGSDRSLVRTLTDPESLTGQQFGYAVAGAGDITGDGVEDIAVGSPGPLNLIPLPCDPSLGMVCPPAAWGRVFLFNGSSGAHIRKLVPSTADFLKFGFALANLGDVSGDGVPDLAVGSPVLMNFWGSVHAFSGATGTPLWATQEPGTRQIIASFGEFLAPLADVNGDGRPDLVVAAPFFDNDPSTSAAVLTGKAFVLSGATGAILREHLSAAPVDGGFYGGKVSGLGDQNGDGVGDYLIGDRGTGAIDLRSGASGGLIRSIPAPADESVSGLFALARAGDRDADGKEDFWVGALLSRALHLLNETGGVLLHVSDPGAPVAGSDGFAAHLAATGDLNADGKPELLISKAGEMVSGAAAAGVVYLLESNRPPDADAGPDQVVPAGPDCLATVTFDAGGSSDPDGDTLTYTWTGSFGSATGLHPEVSLPLGIHVVTLSVDDGHGGVDSDTVTITVVDTTGPTITSSSATPAVLWPPNHRMVRVEVAISAFDNCTAVTCRIAGVSSTEAPNGTGDGNTAPDWTITGPLTVELRAERAGPGTGRTYAVLVECVDGYGNKSSTTVLVSVPHSRKKA